ncbi:MAG TPA: ribosome biogenesis factor YjgA [Xanthomonadales bacterium]|nr:ribosome biogenesis factor YjgA [Xanthomonadales bacterium]
MSEYRIVARTTKFQYDEATEHLISEPEDGSEVSKSQLKREALSKKSLAAEVIALGNKQFANAPLDEDLREEFVAARKITAHVARKRQLMFVAKKLRNIDTTEIEQFLASLQQDANQVTLRHHRAEAWRDRLLATESGRDPNGDQALAEFLELRPDADRQALRQLIRNARREMAAGKPPASARSLFRMLRDLDGIEPLPACS